MDYFDKRDNVPLCEDVKGISLNQLVNAGSEIQKFYENKNVFVTDADGLGGLLVEKLLRSCPKIGTIYLLMKIEKNKLNEERRDESFLSEVCGKINLTHKYLKRKIKIVYGDYTQPYCGISEIDQKILNDGIQIMFHCTGAANKYENLRSLYIYNIQSTKSLLELARKMKKLKAFIYVSTVNAINFQQDVQEKFHERIFIDNNLKSWEEQLQVVTPKITRRRGDLNDFTKAVAEDIVQQYNGKLPIAIARSSCGFYQNNMLSRKKLFNIPTETFSTFISALKYYTCETNKNATTADNFVNTIVAISWQVGKNDSNRDVLNISVYDCILSFNPRIQSNCGEHCTEDTDLIYLAISKKYSEVNKTNENNNNRMYYRKKYMYPVLLLLLLNLYFKIYSNTQKILNAFVNTDGSISSARYYHQEAWSNKPSNIDKLWSSMSNLDKKLFNFDIINNEWKYCNSRSIRNMIAYIFKEDLCDLENTNANFERYKQIKMYLSILRCGAVVYFIISTSFLLLLQTLNKVLF